MKLVIDIPKEKIKSLKKCLETGCALGMTDRAVLNGIPLIVCKDCQSYDTKTHWCYRKCINIKPDGYCSEALKKEDSNECTN